MEKVIQGLVKDRGITVGNPMLPGTIQGCDRVAGTYELKI